MKITYRRTSFNVKELKIHVEDVDEYLPTIRDHKVISTPEQFMDLLNNWNKRAQYNAMSGLPIYVYTMEGIENK